MRARCELTYPEPDPFLNGHVPFDDDPKPRLPCGDHYHHHQMPRRVQASDSGEEESQYSSAARKSRRVTDGSRNPRNLTQTNSAPDSEEEAESPKGRKRARANTGGDSHQVKDETDGSSASGPLIRDTDG